MLAKRIAHVIAIALLLPLAVFYGVNLVHPAPDYVNSTELEQKKASAKTPAVKRQVDQELQRRQTAFDSAQKRHDRSLFFVGYPVGMIAFLVGGIFALGADSIGLMYGGILTLVGGSGCYWANMDRWLRFETIILALVVFLLYGFWKLRSEAREAPIARPAPSS